MYLNGTCKINFNLSTNNSWKVCHLINYPFIQWESKLIHLPTHFSDLIAIPDFSAGAMENWGLITYRENSLLFSEFQTSVIAKQWIAVVVAHELAHQWFGNLVTMKWWNDIWLNEGEDEYIVVAQWTTPQFSRKKEVIFK